MIHIFLQVILESASMIHIAIFILILVWTYVRTRKPKNFPPGPPRLPIVGSITYMMGSGNTPSILLGITDQVKYETLSCFRLILFSLKVDSQMQYWLRDFPSLFWIPPKYQVCQELSPSMNSMIICLALFRIIAQF